MIQAALNQKVARELFCSCSHAFTKTRIFKYQTNLVAANLFICSKNSFTPLHFQLWIIPKKHIMKNLPLNSFNKVKRLGPSRGENAKGLGGIDPRAL
jgi:hypothetical protein